MAQGAPPPTQSEQAASLLLPVGLFFFGLLAVVLVIRIIQKSTVVRKSLRSSGLITLVAIACLAAIAPLPYDFYLALRVLVFASAGVLAWHFRAIPTKWLAPALLITALLYNPIFPVSLTKEIWMALNLSAAALFGFAAYSNLRKS